MVTFLGKSEMVGQKAHKDLRWNDLLLFIINIIIRIITKLKEMLKNKHRNDGNSYPNNSFLSILKL